MLCHIYCSRFRSGSCIVFDQNDKRNKVLSLTERDVYCFFGAAVASEGDTYQKSGRVLSAKFDLPTKTLKGEVQGSVIRPYEVVIRFAGDDIKSTSCTCPLRAMCKHG